MARRLTLLLSTPRIAPGLFSRDAWTALANAAHVFTRDEDETQLIAVQQSGIAAVHLGEQSPVALARLLIERTIDGEVVWIGSADGDPGLTDALAAEITQRDDAPEIEVLVGSYDVPGARLLDLVAVMDRLRSPGGCPWDAEQTHESLVPYLIEETHELVEAIESGDRAHMTEELGDVLLQVAFHARMGQEHPESPFGIDDVAAGIVDKLVRRHPHVFAEVDAETAQDVAANWEQIKAHEKPHRNSPMDGIPEGLHALARADKVAARLSAAGKSDLALTAAAGGDLGSRLFALVLEARENGQDAEAALRASVRALTGQL
ncbi:MAG: MazG family protein [Actinobacteria bacterium]|nr:MazG family protein [Actinomycetota bacterium]